MYTNLSCIQFFLYMILYIYIYIYTIFSGVCQHVTYRTRMLQITLKGHIYIYIYIYVYRYPAKTKTVPFKRDFWTERDIGTTSTKTTNDESSNS